MSSNVNKVVKRGKWSSEELKKGMELLREGYSQHQASILSGVPRRTLRNHLITNSDEKNIGRRPILNKEQETNLVERIIRFAQRGLPLTPLAVRRCVYQYCEKHSITHPFSHTRRCAGRKWYKLFMKRQPRLSQRRAQFMNSARAQKLNPFIVGDYFKKLEEVYTEKNSFTSPHRIYNMDEKGCRLTIHHQQTVLAEKGAKRVHMVANEHAENVTIVGCVNALGHAVPPMIIYKGKRKKPVYEDNLPVGSIVAMAQKGSITVNVFNVWLQHFAKYKGSEEVLLILDGAKCHLDISICELAEDLNIYIFCLPSNTTHELQPLDKSCYKSFESWWDIELLLFWTRYPDRSLNKERFGMVLTPVWQKTMAISNIVNGFREVGIFPFNPNAIPEEAYMPSLLSQRPEPGPALVDMDDNEEPDPDDEVTILKPAPSSVFHSPVTASSSLNSDAANTPDLDSTPLQPQCASSLLVSNAQDPITSSASAHDESPPFSTVLISPQIPEKKRKIMKKAVNYKATVLHRGLFVAEGATETKKTGQKKKISNVNKNVPKRKRERPCLSKKENRELCTEDKGEEEPSVSNEEPTNVSFNDIE